MDVDQEILNLLQNGSARVKRVLAEELALQHRATRRILSAINNPSTALPVLRRRLRELLSMSGYEQRA